MKKRTKKRELKKGTLFVYFLIKKYEVKYNEFFEKDIIISRAINAQFNN